MVFFYLDDRGQLLTLELQNLSVFAETCSATYIRYFVNVSSSLNLFSYLQLLSGILLISVQG